MSAPEIDAAVDVLARHVIACEIIANADLSDHWEDLPLVGERDWGRIQLAAERIATDLAAASDAEFEAAYRLLAGRADR